MEGDVGKLVDFFYKEIVGSYWDAERKHIDEGYKNVVLDFNKVKLINDVSIQLDWTIEEVKGYFNSWSSVQNYIAKKNYNPVNDIINDIANVWGNATTHKAVLPVFMKTGKK